MADTPLYQPSQKDVEARTWAYDAFDVMYENHRRSYTQFNGVSLQKYLDEGRQAFNLMAQPRRDGRSNIKSVAPLNKLMAILARVALSRPKIAVTAVARNNSVDMKRGQILEDLYEYTEQNLSKDENANVEYFFDAFDCQADGTRIVYEGFDHQVHTRKTIDSYDPDTGEVKYSEEEYVADQCIAYPIMPEHFFVWNPYIRSVQKQPKIAWRQVYSKSHFDREFGGYKKAKYVKQRSAVNEYDSDSYYTNRWSNRLDEADMVEVIRTFDRYEDRMVIVANGVVLQDSPLPWENGKFKKYPFAKVISAPFAGGEFFWGMHLWHKLKGDVSALETLYNLGIEQAKLAVNPPVLTTAQNEIEDHMLLPGRQMVVDDIANFRELQFKSPDSSFFGFVELIGKNVDFSSLDPVSQGQNVSNTTARGQVIAEENARKLLSQFNMMMESLIEQKAKLRIPNIVQFMVVPGAQYRVENTTVGGESGDREIVVKENREEFETPTQLDMLEKVAELQGINLERINITPDYLRNIEYSVKVIPETAYQQGKSLQIALELEKIGTIAKFFPNIFQSASEIFFKDLMKAYEDDPQRVLDSVKQTVGMKDAMMQLQGAQQGQPPQQPGPQGQPSPLVSDMTGNTMGLPKLSGVES
jgi:hypothetical protein